jgi:hypothetical protein
MNLTFHQWPWIKVKISNVNIKVMALSWVQCNNSVKYYSNSWTECKVTCMVRIMSKTTMCIVTLTVDQWSCIKVVTLPWVQCKNSMKYYSNPCFQWKLRPGQCLNHNEHWDIDLRPITLNQGHDTSLGPGQQSCEILFKSTMQIRNYSSDKLGRTPDGLHHKIIRPVWRRMYKKSWYQRKGLFI